MKATEFCQVVESRLGWEAPAGPPYRRYMVEAAKVDAKIATNPALYTEPNMMLAVELLARERLSRSPRAVLDHVNRALDLSLDVDDAIEEAIREAVRIETERGDPEGWGERFARTVGQFRRRALDEWNNR